MHCALRLTLIALALAVPDLPRMGHAAGTPAQVCAGAKLKATAKVAGARVVCHAKAAQKGIAADGACLTNTHTKLVDAFSKAEAKGGCAIQGDAGTMDALLDSSMGAFVAALRPVSDANRCAAAKLKATGKKSKTKLGCHAKAVKQGGTVDPACLSKAEARFVAAFAKAEARPPCLTTGDSVEVEDLVDDLVDGAVAGSPTTTTSTTLGPVCGDGVLDPATESCDGADFASFCDSGRTGCVPPGNPNECTCCLPPGVSSQIQYLCCDGQPSFFDVSLQSWTCPTCEGSTFPQCGGNCRPGNGCVSVSEGGEDRCVCMSSPPPPVIPCDGGSGFPTCDGACPAGQQCGYDRDWSPFPDFSCACFPVGETPCGDAEYPQCGGVCLRNHVCQALGGGGSGSCGCVDATVGCGGSCPPGLGPCASGRACMFIDNPFPQYPDTCECVAP
jgi:hypothetical protein